MFSSKPKPSAKQFAREQKRNLSHENRNLTREITRIEREEKKIEAEIRRYLTMMNTTSQVFLFLFLFLSCCSTCLVLIFRAGKKGDRRTMTTLAKALVQTRAQKDRLKKAISMNTSLGYQVDNQTRNLNMVEHLKTSTKTITAMNEAINPQEIQQTLQQFSQQTQKNEMVNIVYIFILSYYVCIW